MNYKFAYSVGFHPWEDAEHEPGFVKIISDLFVREEKDRKPPYGRALDLGCGSGIWGVQLAKRGWQVTGIDCVTKALERAHERVASAGVEMQLIQGDVTSLRAAGVGTNFRLILDSGTFHDFNESQRMDMGREIEAVAASDATVLLREWRQKEAL